MTMDEFALATPYGVGAAAIQLTNSYAILRLLSLDDVWSFYLDSRFPKTAPDYDGLIELADMIDGGIVEAERAVREFRQYLEVWPDEFINGAMSSMTVIVNEQGVKWPFRRAFVDVPIRQWLMDACQFVQDRAPNERDILSRKRQQLEIRDTLPPPDLTIPWKCVAGFIGVAMGAAAAALQGLAAGPVGAVLSGSSFAVLGTIGLLETSACKGGRVRNTVSAHTP